MSSINSSSVDFDIYTYEGSPNVKVIYGYSTAVVTCAFFVAIDNVIKNVGYPKNVKLSDLSVWRNIMKSWIHALIASGLVIYCFSTNIYQMYDDPFLYCDYAMYLTVAFTTGYFCYDIFDNVLNYKFSEKWEIYLHHVIIIASFLYNIQNRVFLPYAVFSLLPEINTVFLHFRKLIHLQGWPRDHILYRSVVILNFVTFIIFRLTWNVLFCAIVQKVGHKITLPCRVLVGLTTHALLVLNSVLLWRLFKIDFLIYYNKSVKNKIPDSSVQNGIIKTDTNSNVKRDKYL